MAAWQLALVLAACLFDAGDRAAVSWERSYSSSVRWFNHGQFEKARATAEAGYRTNRAHPQSDAFWLCRIALAESLIELDRTKDALPLLETTAPTNELEARRLSDLAMVQFRSGQYDPAWQSTDAAARIGSAAGRDTTAKVELIRGMLLLRREQMPDAETSLRNALAGTEGSDSLIEAYTLSDLGFLSIRRFRYDEALYWFTRARDLSQRNDLARPLELATGNLGAVYRNLGDFDRAAENLAKADREAEQLHDHFYQMPILILLGETWEESGDLDRASSAYQKAQSLANPDHDVRWLAKVFHNLAEMALRKGDPASAEKMNTESAAMARRAQSSPALLSAEVQSAGIAAAQHDYAKAESLYRQTLDATLRAHDPENAFECHAGLSELYRQTGATAKAASEFRAALAATDELDSTLQQDESKISFLSRLIQFYRDYVDFLIDRGDGEGAFRVAESSRARVLQEKLHGGGRLQSPDPQGLQQEARDSGAILLSYWLAPRRSFLWIIDPVGLHTFQLPAEPEIAARVDSYNSAIQRGDDPARTGNEAGRWLFANLLGAHYQLPERSNIVIEADGVLHHLNFETLAPEDGRYWIDDATISVAPSLALLERSRYTPGGRLLAFGDPGYDGTEFQRLTNLQAELQAVENHFPDKRVYVSSAATPSAYRASHPETYSNLHFAAHAVANRESPLDSAIVLAGPPDSRKLYAREILGHPLSAELVTLSACQTAGSRTYYGEGLTGFSWAFLSAGARNVVAGLWDVDDRATTALMKGFYDELASGPSPVSALRSAKLRLIASGGTYRKPRYWAAFECFTRALY